MLQELLLDPHDAYHVHQVVNRPLDFVLDESVFLDNVVLELQIFKSLDHFLDFPADLCGIFVLKVFDGG